MENTPSDNNNDQPLKPQGSQLPEGFRVVEEGEVIPPGYETRMDLTLERTITNAPKSQAPPQKFPEPRIVEAIIDPNTKPQEKPQAFSFTSPQIIQKNLAQPTKGDVQNLQEGPKKSSQPLSDAEKLKNLDDEIRRDAAGEKKDYSYDEYHDTAEMAVEGIEGLVQFAALMIDKSGSPSAYAFLEEKKNKLIRMGTKISRKRGWVLTPEVAFLGTLLPISGRIIIKARDNRKDYMDKRRQEEATNTPAPIVKGGPNKGDIKTRGPGRPRK